MTRKLVFLGLLVLLCSWLYVEFNQVDARATNGERVHNIDTRLNYTKIQEAIDAVETLDGHTIFVEEGTYYEHVVVNKSLSLIGMSRDTTIIDGNGTGIVIFVTASSVTIKEFTVKNGDTGIYLDRSNNSLIMKNNVSYHIDAIFVRYSCNCTIHQNIAGNNTNRGVLVTNSWNFTLSNNNVYGNGWYGINANASVNGLIKQNNAYKNDLDGIGLLDSNNCTIAENTVENNKFCGILIETSSESFIYHNNIIDNGIQAESFQTNQWDNGLEGNYWSNYTGVDSNRDGIGDTSHVINENNTDPYPLMGIFHSFNTSLSYYVNVISNSAVEDFEYFESNNTIKMHVTNVTANQTFGFCRIRIPHPLMSEPYNVTVDGVEPYYVNYTLYDDGESRWIYFSYEHSTLEVVIIPEFSHGLIIPLTMVATLLAFIAHKRKPS